MASSLSATAASSHAAAARNQACRKLYDALIADASSTHFKVLPDPFLYASYYAVITRPICLADMKIFIEEGAPPPPGMPGRKTTGRYTLAEMQRDLRRMIANAKKYNLPDSAVYQDALALERVVRRVVKEIEREGEADDDEDAAYARTNRDRAYYENMEREQARAWVQQLAHRRATMVAQRASRDAVRNIMEDVFQEFVDDGDLFRRGAESFLAFHDRKLRRGVFAAAKLSHPRGQTAAALAVQSSSVGTSSRRGSISRDVEALDEEEDDCLEEEDDDDLYVASVTTGSQRARTAVYSDMDGMDEEEEELQLGAAHAPPIALDPEVANAPGSIGAPIVISAREEYVRRVQAEAEAAPRSHKAKPKAFSASSLAASAASAGVADVSSTSASSVSAQASAADAAGSFGYLRAVGKGIRTAAMAAQLPFDYVAPPRGSHTRVCRLCAPSLLEERTISRKGVEENGVSARDAVVAAAAVLTPHFTELSPAYLQGLLPPQAPHRESDKVVVAASPERPPARASNNSQSAPSPAGSPVIIIGADDALHGSSVNGKLALGGNSVFQRLSKLSRELGVALAIDTDRILGLQPPPAPAPPPAAAAALPPRPRAAVPPPAPSTSSSRRSSVSITLDASRDRAGYDAAISAAFWNAYNGHKTAINAHDDSIVAFYKSEQPRKRAREDGGDVTGLPSDRFRGERWLVRKRVHYCETHSSDSDLNPIVEGFTSESSAYAPYILRARAAMSSDGTPLDSDVCDNSDDDGSHAPRRRASGRPALITPASKLTAGAVAVANAILRGVHATSADLLANVHAAEGVTPGDATTARPFDPTELGCMIDVRDSGGSWWLAQVIDVKTRDERGGMDGVDDDDVLASGAAHAIRVHYQGWAEEYDEWVPVPTPATIAAITARAPPTQRLSASLRAEIAAARVAPAMSRSGVVGSTSSCRMCDNTRAGQLLFCDTEGCRNAYHMHCLRPPVTSIPAGKWYCPEHRRGGSNGSAPASPSTAPTPSPPAAATLPSLLSLMSAPAATARPAAAPAPANSSSSAATAAGVRTRPPRARDSSNRSHKAKSRQKKKK